MMVNGNTIKQYRIVNGITKTQFSKETGIQVKTLSRIEKSDNVKSKYIDKIEKRYKIGLENYFCDSTLLPFGLRIKLFRSEMGLSSLEFAEELGVDKTYISAIEKGKRNPSPPLLKRICEVFKLDMEDIYLFTLKENSTLGEQLRYYRKLNGFTQKELAKKYGVSKTFISKAERDKFVRTNQLNKIKSIVNLLKKQ